MMCIGAGASAIETDSIGWCGLDTGYATITDRDGYPRSVFVSVRRDGSVWLRFGRDHASLEWIYADEPRTRLQSVILDSEAINLLQVRFAIVIGFGRLNFRAYSLKRSFFDIFHF